MKIINCGFCHRVLSLDKWIEQKDLIIDTPIKERIYVVCPVCLSKRGEADFFKKEVFRGNNNL